MGPLFFTIYIQPVTNVAESFGVNQQQYADDTLLYIELSANALEIAVRENENCVAAPQLWFAQNGLADKSEAILLSTADRANSLSSLIYHQCC